MFFVVVWLVLVLKTVSYSLILALPSFIVHMRNLGANLNHVLHGKAFLIALVLEV